MQCPMTDLIEQLRGIFGQFPQLQNRVLYSLLTIALLILLRWLVLRLVYRRSEDVRFRYHARKMATYVSVAAGLLVIGLIWSSVLRDFGTIVGLLSAGLAIALKDLVASVAGWVYLMWRRPFEVGDRVQIGEHAGDVIDIRLFRFSLMEIGNWVGADQSTGRVIHIPNSLILSNMIANYSKGFMYIWNELPVLVTFESDWKKAKGILQEIADRHSTHLSEAAADSVRKASQRAMVIYSVLTPKVWTKVDDSGVLLTIRYLCEPRRRRSSAEEIWEDVLTAFGECDDIDFAYPTMRRYINPDEGKPELGGPVKEGGPE